MKLPVSSSSGSAGRRVIPSSSLVSSISYTAAAANLIFSNAVAVIGWGNLILVWLGLMGVGITIALPYKKWWVRPEI